MTHAQQQRALRKEFHLPFHCECGGKLEYEHAFGRIFNHCLKCTPVVNWPEVCRSPAVTPKRLAAPKP